MVAVTAALSLTAFWWQAPPTLLLLPVMAWAAFRLDVIGAAIAGAALAFTLNYATGSGRGLFTELHLAAPGRLAVTQGFIGVIVLVAMLIAQEAAGRVAAVRRGDAERRERDRLETLAQLAQRLSAALTPSQIGDAVVTQLFDDAGAQAVALGLLNSDGSRLQWVKTAELPAACARQARSRHPPRRPHGGHRDSAYRATRGHRQRCGIPAAVSRYGDMMAATGAEALVNWSLTSGGKPIGVLGLMWTRPQPLDAAQLAYVSAVATMVGQALVRAQVYADEHARAAVLQAAVLPTEPADIAELDLAVSYEMADAVHGLGGDWYDVMSLPKQRTYLAVGDVVGHGLPAVEDMAQLRTAARAMALQGLPPARLLAELNAFTAHTSHGRFATIAVAIFDPLAGVLSYGLAGHPPPLLRRSRDGNVVRLVDADGPVLGPIRDATYTEGQVKLERGDILVMYTDGLVERSGRDIETGISQAERLLASWRSENALAQGCRQLTETLASPPRQDDVCVIAVRVAYQSS